MQVIIHYLESQNPHFFLLVCRSCKCPHSCCEILLAAEYVLHPGSVCVKVPVWPILFKCSFAIPLFLRKTQSTIILLHICRVLASLQSRPPPPRPAEQNSFIDAQIYSLYPVRQPLRSKIFVPSTKTSDFVDGTFKICPPSIKTPVSVDVLPEYLFLSIKLPLFMDSKR